jgi:hypothetical protein
MTRFEKLTVACSVAALLISLATPVVTYYFLDPQAKDYEKRGLLAAADTEAWETYLTDPKTNVRTGPFLDFSTTLYNIGSRPIKELKVVVATNETVALSAEDRLVTNSSNAENLHEYVIAGALSPKGKITLRFAGAMNANLVAFTEHGDRIDLFRPDPIRSESKPASK